MSDLNGDGVDDTPGINEEVQGETVANVHPYPVPLGASLVDESLDGDARADQPERPDVNAVLAAPWLYPENVLDN